MMPSPHSFTQKLAGNARRALCAAGALLLSSLIALDHAHADTASVVDATNAFKATLASSQISSLEISYTLANAEVWSNLPGPARNGLKLGNLSSTQLNAALTVIQTALSSSGYTLFSEIRAADDLLGASQGGYGSGNYYIAFLGTPSTTSPWMLQVGGHHLAYNISFNGNYPSATPEFDGVEPPNWTDSSGVAHAPLEAQRAAVQTLAQAIQADSNVAAAAKLSGTFTDVVLGPNGTGGYDRNFPQTYPTSGRGVLYSALTDTAKSYVKTAIEAWVNTPGDRHRHPAARGLREQCGFERDLRGLRRGHERHGQFSGESFRHLDPAFLSAHRWAAGLDRVHRAARGGLFLTGPLPHALA
jgi:hypothetical protein